MKWFKPEKMSKGLYHKYLEEALGSFPENRETIRSAWRCPSNIALVKYWGKKPKQIPANPSLSFTLSNSYTEMTLTASRCAGKDPELEYFFEGVKNEAFETRIRGYLSNINACFPFLSGCDLRIESHNTFPHSSGIASSASSMGALALGICSIEQQLRDGDKDEEFYRKASYMARLASGSAARSVYGGFVTWGKQEGFEFTSDEFATPMMENAGPALSDLCDAVLIISPDKKPVSSSQGHALMDHHTYAGARYLQARENFVNMHRAILGNDLARFIQITENEALVLHGLMMSSDPAYLLMKPGTLEVITRIQRIRKEKDLAVAFTLDAGPNVHLIYPGYEREKVLPFIREELLPYCHQAQWIDDRMGPGPEELIT